MKVVCVDNGSLVRPESLTLGKVYEVKENEHILVHNFYKVLNNFDSIDDYNVGRFVPLKEYRKQKINKICLK